MTIAFCRHAATLYQMPNPPKIPVSNWKCDECDIKDGLWMNLTDSRILCGRWNFDGTGGNGHAIAHYEKTKYPLAVKLGTITPTGAGNFHFLCLSFSHLITIFLAFSYM